MRGLMIKDMYTAYKQSKIMVFLLFIILLIPVDYIFGYAIFAASMLPVTALSYDERSKWNRLVFMMPYSNWEVVLSKYMEGYLVTGIIAIIAACIQCVKIFIYGNGSTAQTLLMVLMFTCAAFIINAVVMPFVFSIGVEKGRVVWVFFTVICMMGAINAVSFLETSPRQIILDENSLFCLTGVILAVTALSNLVSILITGKIYEMKRG